MKPIEDALARLMARIEPLESERIPVEQAVGRVLQETVRASRMLPPWDNSAMDGYAVRAADLADLGAQDTLPVVDEVAAGDPGDRPLPPGAAARIFTGAPMPPGADTVVIQEDARRSGDRVAFTERPSDGANVRRAGTDVAVGAEILRPGRVLTPGDIGLMSALGRSGVDVTRVPVVAIAGSGDELVPPDAGVPGPGRIVNSNLAALSAAVAEAGATPRGLPNIPDTREATVAGLRAAARADAVLTSGGMSVGAYDFVRHALVELSGDAFEFWKVRVKPGKPLGFGFIDGAAVFGLPGNPISALVTFDLFVRPALLRMMGHTRVFRPVRAATLRAPIRAGGGRVEYLRAAAFRAPDGTFSVDARRNQSSGALSSLGGADALVIRPIGAPALDAGASVPVLVLGPDNPADRLESPQPAACGL
jgi:molybdopterin molybdotransferase